MRIGGRAGHTTASCGASGLIDENTESRKVIKRVSELLRAEGVEYTDLQPNENLSYPQELSYGISKANNSNLDLAFSIHFNNAYSTYSGALGTEVEIYPNSSCKALAGRITQNLSSLGFKARGIQERTDLGEIRSSSCPWVIIEVCFVEATEDVRVYKAVGVEAVAKAIVEGILNKKLSAPAPTPAPKLDIPADFNWYEYLKRNDDVMKCVLNGGFNSGTNGQQIENACKCHYIEHGKSEGRIYK